MQRKYIRFSKTPLFSNKIIHQINGPGMANHFLMVLERLAGDGHSFFQDKSGLTKGQCVALDSRGIMGSQIPKLDQQGFTEIIVKAIEESEHYCIPYLF